MGIFVESWAPEYGTPLEHDPSLSSAAASIDTTVETDDWMPCSPPAGAADAIDTVWFVDGVRRVDARLTLDEPTGPVPGLCGTVAVGATHWDRTVPKARIDHVRVERLAIVGSGRSVTLPAVGRMHYESASVAGDDPAEPIRHLHDRMRRSEAELARRLASDGDLVIADGPINELRPQPVIGYIKSHRVNYLAEPETAVVAALAAGQRTPMFAMDAGPYVRYSWYLRLADIPGGHTWSGVVRCEVPAALGTGEAIRLADAAAELLPQVAPPLHVDPRAPQNLVPIGALERRLRRACGDAGLVYRAIRQAVMDGAA